MLSNHLHDAGQTTWWPRVMQTMQQLHRQIAWVIAWADVRMGDFNLYLFLKYMTTSVGVYLVASVGFGWVTLVVMYCVLCHSHRQRVNTRLQLAYVDPAILKDLCSGAGHHLLPPWVSLTRGVTSLT